METVYVEIGKVFTTSYYDKTFSLYFTLFIERPSNMVWHYIEWQFYFHNVGMSAFSLRADFSPRSPSSSEPYKFLFWLKRNAWIQLWANFS